MNPINGLAKRLLPLRQVQRTTRQQLQAALQPIKDGAGRQNLYSGSRELNRQRQSIQAQTDFLNHGCVFLSNCEIGPDRSGALHKQFDCGILGKGSDGEFLFAINTTGGSAGDKYLERWTGLSSFGHYGGGRE